MWFEHEGYCVNLNEVRSIYLKDDYILFVYKNGDNVRECYDNTTAAKGALSSMLQATRIVEMKENKE